MKAMINDNIILYLENNIHLPSSARTHLDCIMDTGPSCKELGLFNKYNCFSFDLHVCRLILESEGKQYDKTDPFESDRKIFSPQNKLLYIKVSHVNFEVA